MRPTIQCTIQNRMVTFHEPYPHELIDKLTSYSIPGAYFMPLSHRYQRMTVVIDGQKREVLKPAWDGKKHFLQHDMLPLGLFLAIMPELVEKNGYRVHWEVESRFTPKPVFPTQSLEEIRQQIKDRFPEAREFQVEAVSKMIDYIGCGGLILSATGSGKTYLAGMFLSLIPKEIQSLFVVDELTLLHQAQKELSKVTDETVGIVGEGIFDPKRITVATIQSLQLFQKRKKFIDWFKHLGIVIVDEIHVQMSRRNFKILDKICPRAVYGLTATLELGKKEIRTKAYAIAGPVIYEYPIYQGVKDRNMVQPVVIGVTFRHPIVSGESKRRYPGRWQKEYLDLIVRRKRRNDLVEKLIRFCMRRGRKAIVLTERVRHLQILYRRVEDLKPMKVHGEVSRRQRMAVQKGFEKGKVRLIVTNKVFEKGVNIKAVDTGIDCSAMKSKNKAIQRVGRIVRMVSGKPYALFFDIVDRGTTFENAWKSRRSAYRKNRIPVFMVRGSRLEKELPDLLLRIDRKYRPKAVLPKRKHGFRPEEDDGEVYPHEN